MEAFAQRGRNRQRHAHRILRGALHRSDLEGMKTQHAILTLCIRRSDTFEIFERIQALTAAVQGFAGRRTEAADALRIHRMTAWTGDGPRGVGIARRYDAVCRELAPAFRGYPLAAQ